MHLRKRHSTGSPGSQSTAFMSTEHMNYSASYISLLQFTQNTRRANQIKQEQTLRQHTSLTLNHCHIHSHEDQTLKRLILTSECNLFCVLGAQSSRGKMLMLMLKPCVVPDTGLGYTGTSFFFFFFCVALLYLWGSPFGVRFLYVTVF